MNLLDAFKQYIRDAMPGGALNPEVTTQGVLDAAALGTAPVPIVGDAIGLAADVRRLAKNPEERTPMNYGLTALGALPFVPGGLAGMFVGKGAKTWDAISAAKAKELADKGVDARQIWKETGTFKGPDGHWRQEIDDSGATFIDKFRKATSQEFDDFFKAKVTVKEVDDLKSAARQSGDFSIPKFYGDKPGLYDKYRSAKDTISKYERQFMNPSEIKKGPLGNFLDHDKLDAAYPSLYDIPTTHNKNHSGGAFFENMNELLIGGTQEKSTTLHELQHAIQGKEGWARGGSPESMPKIISELIDQGAAKAQKLRSLAYRGDPLAPFDVVKPGALDKALDTEMGVRRLKDWQARLNAFPDSYTNDAYRSLAGEAEARATQARMNMNAAQRREVFPLDSYDVPLDELIVRWGGDGPAMAIDPAGKKRLIDDLTSGKGSGTYRLGDVTEGQKKGLSALFGHEVGKDVYMNDKAFEHILKKRVHEQSMKPEMVGRYAEQAMAPASRAAIDPSKAFQNPSLTNYGLLQDGRRYDAKMPLGSDDLDLFVRTVYPEGLKKKKPR